MLGSLLTEEIDEVLSRNILGRLGCNDGVKTYVIPINYIYDGKCIIAHSVEGMKIKMMRKNNAVCFEVDEITNQTNWKSVIVWGTYHEITSERERYEAMKLFVNKTLKLKISKTTHTPELNENREHPESLLSVKPVIFRILIDEKTGRYETEHADEYHMHL